MSLSDRIKKAIDREQAKYINAANTQNLFEFKKHGYTLQVLRELLKEGN